MSRGILLNAPDVMGADGEADSTKMESTIFGV